MKNPILLPLLASALLLGGCNTTETTMKPGRPPAPEPTATSAPMPPPAPAPNLAGDWTWVCCDGHFSGTMKLQQDANKITGRFYDGGDTTGGAVDGSITGNKVQFTRTWGDDSRQDYTLTVSDDGNKVQGELDGTRDESFGTHFEATRK